MARRLGPHGAQLHLPRATPPRWTAPWWPRCPDIRTESRRAGRAPAGAAGEVGRARGAAIAELAELDAFFQRTGYPRAPRYYLIKWLTDWVRELGFDGYRVDTAKHFGRVGQRRAEARGRGGAGRLEAGAPRARIPDDLPFYMVGEVYGWEASQGRRYDFGDRTVDFFSHGYDALINFGFKSDATARLDGLFTGTAATLHGGPLRRGRGAQLPQLPRRRLAVRRGPKGSAGRRHSPPARPRRRADLLRGRAGAAASGRGRGGRRESALVHELG